MGYTQKSVVCIEARKSVGPLGLVLQGVVSHLLCMLGTELGSSAQIVWGLPLRAVSPVPLSALPEAVN